MFGLRIGKFLANRKHRRLATVVIALLCLAVMILTVFLLSNVVFADSVSRADLRNFTTSVVVLDGAGNPIPSGGSVIKGSNYTLRVSFKETPSMQFVYDGGKLTYQLPAGVTVPASVYQAPIYGPSGAVIGRYDITTGGLVSLAFSDVYASGLHAPGNFIDIYTNAEFTLDLLARFDGGSGAVEFDFGNHITVNITLDSLAPYPQIAKSAPGGLDPLTKKINYAVTVKAVNGDLPIVSFSDWATAAGKTIPGGYLTLSAVAVEIDGTPVPVTPTWRVGANPPTFDILFPAGTIIPNTKSMTVSYTIDLTDFMAQPGYGSTNYYFTVHNEATLTYLDPNENPQTAKAMRDVSVSKAFLSKSGKFTPDDPDVPGVGEIAWTIDIGDSIADLAGKTVTDTLGPNFEPSDRPSQVTLKLYDATKAQIGPDVILTPPGLDLPAGSNAFSFDIPDNLGAVYYATITYTTPVDIRGGSATAVGFTNNVTINTTVTSGSVIVSKPGVKIMDNSNIKKEIVSFTADMIQYKITVMVPKDMAGKDFYLDDEARIEDYNKVWPGGKVLNQPENFKITYNGVEHPFVDFTESYYAVPPYKAVVFNFYSEYSDLYRGRWLLFFDGGTNNNTSKWPQVIDEDTEIVITYDLPMSTPILPNTGVTLTEEQMTLGSLLKSNPRLELLNTCLFKTTSTGNGGASLKVGWPISKNWSVPINSSGSHWYGRPAEVKGQPDVLEYEVILNPTWGMGYRTHYALFQDDGPVMFFDEFDDRMEYVPGSFHVFVSYSDGSGQGWPVGGGQIRYFKFPNPGAESAAIVGNKINVNLADLIYTSHNGSSAYCAYGNPPPTNWYNSLGVPGAGYQQNSIVIRYQLKVTGADELEEPIYLKNTAGFIGNGKTHHGAFTSDSTVKYGKEPIEKTMKWDGTGTGTNPHGRIATFDIVVNPYGKQFDGGSNLCVTDAMNGDLVNAPLSFFLSSLTAYTGANLDEEQALTQTAELDPGQAWTWALTGENEVTFVIPDATPVRLEYKALVKGNPGQSVQIKNYVEVKGLYYYDYAGSWQVMDTYGFGTGDLGEFTLYKGDAETAGRLLPGARFALYIGWPTGTWGGETLVRDGPEKNIYGGLANPPAAPGGIDQELTDGGYTYFYLCDKMTGDDGTILFDDSWVVWDNADYGAQFAVFEVTPPPGYAAPADPLTLVDPFSGEFTDYLLITNEPTLLEEVVIPCEKKVQGGPPSTPAFTFRLAQVTDATGEFRKIPLFDRAAENIAPGTFGFTLENLGPGTYYYMITEDPGAADPHWTYDDTAYIVRVVVGADNVTGELASHVEYRSRKGGSAPWSAWSGTAGNTVTFTNRYSDGTSAEVALRGCKTVAGADAPDETFTFTLTQWSAADLAGGHAVPGGIHETVAVKTTGEGDYDVVFPAFLLPAGGPYYFCVRETSGGKDGWSYDKTAWLYIVEVSGPPPVPQITRVRQGG